jgi:hypothetical protein
LRPAVLVARFRDTAALLGVVIRLHWTRSTQAIVVGLARFRDTAVLLGVLVRLQWTRSTQAIVVGRARFRDTAVLLGVLVRLYWTRGTQAIDGVKQAPAWPRLWRDLKRTGLRILVSLFVAIVIGTTSYWMWGLWQSWQLADAASITTTWPARTILNDVAVEVQTKCRNSRLSYVIVVLPPNSNAALTWTERTNMAKVMTDTVRTRLKAIDLRFVDKDGLAAAAFDVGIDDFVRIYSSDYERPASLEARGSLTCDPATYLRAAELVLSWTERP